MKEHNKSDEQNKITFQLDTPLLRKILLIITFTLVLYWGLTRFDVVSSVFSGIASILSPFVIGFCIAFIINVLLRPMEKLWDKMFKKAFAKRLKRPVCLCLSTIIVLGIIFALLFMIIPEFTETLLAFADTLPANITHTQNWLTRVSKDLENYGIQIPQLKFDIDELGEKTNQLISAYGQSFLDKTVGVTASIFSGIFTGVIAFVLSIYMLAQKEKLSRQFKKLLFAVVPSQKAKNILEVVEFTDKTFTNFVTGQLTEAVIIGSLCFVGMLILRIPYAPVISVLVGFTSLIPVIGAFIGTAIGAVLILLTSPIKAVWFVIFIIVLQQVENNLIYPKVVGKSVGLPGIWVLTAVTIGGKLFGLFGMLICVPVCSILYAYVKKYTNNKLAQKKIKFE